MSKINHISLRTNETGSYKMRVQLLPSKQCNGKRIQLGLMTKSLCTAISRCIMIWNILRHEAYVKNSPAVLTCEHFTAPVTLPLEKGNTVAYDSSIHDLTWSGYCTSMEKLIPIKEKNFIRMKSGEYAFMCTLVNLDQYEVRHIVLPLMTEQIWSAQTRAFLALRILNRVVGRYHKMSLYLAGKKVLKASEMQIYSCMVTYKDDQ